jgi:tetrapyrrole methylase family protein/MazG family protein
VTAPTEPESLDLADDVRERVVEPSAEAFRKLVAVMARLRTDCPWDREQTHESLARHLLEETYETLEAIDANDLDGLREELGDLVIQVVFHAQLAYEEDAFTIADVLDELRTKLIRRHPHVFGDVEVEGSAEVRANWERIKRGEKKRALYEGIPRSLPALARAAKMQRHAANVGFPPDWDREDVVLEGLAEEIAELRAELDSDDRNPHRVEDELGDVLFVVVVLANRLGVDPENALRRMLDRSQARFEAVERMAEAEDKELESLSREDWARYWDQAKQEIS